MKDEEFLAKLSEVALWKIPEGLRDDSLNQKKRRGRKSTEELYQELHEQEFLDMHDGVNPTQAPMLLKVKKACDCEDCGRHCPEGRHVELKYNDNKTAHWRERCTTCGFSKDPYTGKFNLNGTQASIKWNSFLKETKGAYNTKGNEQRERAGIIRKYPESKEPL